MRKFFICERQTRYEFESVNQHIKFLPDFSMTCLIINTTARWNNHDVDLQKWYCNIWGLDTEAGVCATLKII